MSGENAAILFGLTILLLAPVWLGWLPARWTCAAGFHRWVRRETTRMVRSPPGMNGIEGPPCAVKMQFAQCRSCNRTDWNARLAPEIPPPPPEPLPWGDGP